MFSTSDVSIKVHVAVRWEVSESQKARCRSMRDVGRCSFLCCGLNSGCCWLERSLGLLSCILQSTQRAPSKSRADCQCGAKIMSCCGANMRAALQLARAMCARIILGTNCNGYCTCLAKTYWLRQCSKLLLEQLRASAEDFLGAAEALTLFAFGCTAEACFPTLCIPLQSCHVCAFQAIQTLIVMGRSSLCPSSLGPQSCKQASEPTSEKSGKISCPQRLVLFHPAPHSYRLVDDPACSLIWDRTSHRWHAPGLSPA